MARIIYPMARLYTGDMISRSASIMGMPVEVCLPRAGLPADVEAVFDLLRKVDEQFSTYKATSEMSRINAGLIPESDYSLLMCEVLELCEAVRQSSGGYFNIWNGTILDPSGLVKGWAIDRAGRLLLERGIQDFFLDVGGDVLAMGRRLDRPWVVGVRHPVQRQHNVKRVELVDLAIATSGNYERGDHIYDPVTRNVPTKLRSFTVIGPNIMTADVLATIGFAMGPELGLEYVAHQPGYAAFAITHDLQGLSTPSFAQYNKA